MGTTLPLLRTDVTLLWEFSRALKQKTGLQTATVVSMNDAPIGVFDSGLGGLTVARAIIDKLPNEDVIYLGDTANTPYGPRTIAEVRDLTLAGLDSLVDRGVKMLVMACNSATAAALGDAQERYFSETGIPIIEVITPAAAEAAVSTRNGRVGVIGTETTIKSGAYERSLAAVPDMQVFQSACPQFVDFVERGITTGDHLEAISREYLQPLIDEDVDTLILGCTHYPLLTGMISRVMGPNVTLVASSEATANTVYSQLVDADTLHSRRATPANYQFLTTAQSPQFVRLAKRFMGPVVSEIETITAKEPTA